MAAESKLEKECRKLANDSGYELLKWVSPGVRGVPDRILLRPMGRVAFIEFKAPDGVISPSQDRWLRVLRAMGFEARVIWTLEDFKKLLRPSN